MRAMMTVPLALLAPLAVAATGCDRTDPYLRPGLWQPSGANTLNLAAMVQNPSDLIRGRGAAGTPGMEATPPVVRYWSGKPAGLPSTSSQAGGTGQGKADTASGGTAGTTAGSN